MAGRLLLIILIYSFHEIHAQALLPPKLTCYFYTLSGGIVRSFSCLKTLTASELLKMSYLSLPADVKVKCSYLHGSQSPESDTSSIVIRRSLPPKLTVSPAVITETDSVTLNCQTPSSVTVSQCNFYTVSEGIVRVFLSSCLKTLTATELLEISHQSSPAEVQVRCFYKIGELSSTSPYSEISSINIHSLKPQMSLQHFLSYCVFFTCAVPGSADGGTRCNLYFGEESLQVQTRKIWKETTSKKQSFCRFTVTINDLLSYLSSVQQRDASCDYSLGSEPNSLSPRSDAYSLTDIVEKETHVTESLPTFPVTTGRTLLSRSSSQSSYYMS
ncbi:uncharacterized protein LOC131968347 [Centropristis striata]|uniref:uncharacterized protein LOC131968347 n=1 Tax=Centropristis striata TaxID=184440 RepID=UPI0027E020DB|nr:uncharacterized protein LOC131968347 [Centropristis striata]